MSGNGHSSEGNPPTYLDRIVPAVRRRLEERRRIRPQSRLEAQAGPTGRPSFTAALRAPGISLIAEVKRASPSKGPIRPHLVVGDVVRGYQRAGARALSVLTEEDYFLGGLPDLSEAVTASSLPVLRKDFIVDEYQIHEARVYGASAVLLIVALLPQERLRSLVETATVCGLDVLMEVHDREELERALEHEDVVIGVNNRDLRTFQVSVETTVTLARLVPSHRLLVGESGIAGRADVERLAAFGVDGVLVGESLLRCEDVEAAVVALLPAEPDGGAVGARGGDAEAVSRAPK